MKCSQCARLLPILALLVPTIALAHAFPKHAQPRVGATIAHSPPAVKIWFNSLLEPLFNTLVVTDATGKVVSREPTRVDPDDRSLLEVALPSLPPGTYHVDWHVTSKDGHRTEGDYAFTIGGP